MDSEHEAVEAATRRFYDAIEKMVLGEGTDALLEAWHHGDQVTSRHPIDDWLVGWEQIWPTWQITSTVGRADRGGGKVLSMKTFLYGDVAYAIVSFQAAPAWGGEKLMCTNILHKKQGEWKIIHHHADPSPAMAQALERMFTEQEQG